VEVVCCVYRTQCAPGVHRTVHNNSPRTVRNDTVGKNDEIRKNGSATHSLVFLSLNLSI
jgi:hypothetical protein